MAPHANMFSLFLGIWLGMIALGWMLFYRDGLDAQARNRLWPWWIGGAGVIFVAFLCAMETYRPATWLIAAGISVFAASMIRRIRFCEKCGSLETAQGFLDTPDICSQCGHAIG